MKSEVQISNTQGLTARFIPLGATLTSLFVKDREGNITDVVLGFDDIDGYQNDKAYMGRTIGRVCNRIRNGRFMYDGKEYKLPINCPPHHIHGGPKGIAMREWEVVRLTPKSVTFRICAIEEDDGFPGDVKIDVNYTVNDLNELVIEHGATATTAGVLNLTHHSYWNLDGSASVENHVLQVDAHEYLPTDADDFPTGEILPVGDSRFNFNEQKSLSALLDDNGVIDIDNDFVLRPGRAPAARVMSLYSPMSGIKMDVTTSYPVAHIYGGRHLLSKGKKGEKYGPSKGLAIEAQFHTGALNYEKFPGIPISPTQTYLHEVVHSFSVVPKSD